MSEPSTDEREETVARAEAQRQHPPWHDNGVGIVQAAHWRDGFVAGAKWQAAAVVAALDDESDTAELARRYPTVLANLNTTQDDAARLRAEVERLTECWGYACGRANRASDRAADAETERDAALAALRRVRSIGATSGTNLNAWNAAFDVIDAALSEPTEGDGDRDR